MRDLFPAFDQQSGLIVSVSSLLIMLLLQPLVQNAISASRTVCAASRAVARLLVRDADDLANDKDSRRPRHYCERCARRGGASRADVVAVMASLGLATDDGGGEDHGAGCGGCAAMAVVEELAESKVAGEWELREAFGVFDRDEDGFVGADELWNVMRRLGMPEGAAHDDCRRMIAARDGAGDGRVSFHEFRAMMENAV